MAQSVVTNTSDPIYQIELAGYQLFQQCSAGMPNGTNLYAVCAQTIQYALQPPAYSWVPSLMIALAVLYAVLCLTFAALVVIRIRWGNFWLFRRESTPYGPILVAHTVNFTCIASSLFFGLGLGTIATIYKIAADDPIGTLISSQMFSGLTYYVIFLYAWADMCSILLNVVNWRSSPIGRTRTGMSKRVMAFNTLSVGIPIALLVVLITVFSQLAMQGMQPTVDAVRTMRAYLLKVAPSWTGTLKADDLQPLFPTLVQLLAGAAQFDHWQRVAFSIWIVAVGTLYAAWMPLVFIHVRQLHKQIKMLRGTMSHLTRSRRSPSAVSGVPTYVLGSPVNEKGHRVSVTSAHQSDDAERRVRWLMRVCVFRVFAAVCITLSLAVFASIILLVVIDPRGAASIQSKNFYCRVGALFVPLVLALPGFLTAIQHPRQTESPAGRRPSGEDFFSAVDRSHFSRRSSNISPWRGLGQTSPPLDKDSASSEDNDSAIYHLPTVTASPIAVQPAAHVLVEVETVVRVD